MPMPGLRAEKLANAECLGEYSSFGIKLSRSISLRYLNHTDFLILMYNDKEIYYKREAFQVHMVNGDGNSF